MTTIITYRKGAITKRKAVNAERAARYIQAIEKIDPHYILAYRIQCTSADLTLEDYLQDLYSDDAVKKGVIYITSTGDVIAMDRWRLMSYSATDNVELDCLYRKFERIQFMDCELSIDSLQHIIREHYRDYL